MRSLVFFVISLLSFVYVQAQSPVSYTKEDSLRVVELLEQGAKEMVNGQSSNDKCLTLFYAHQFMNRPYVAHTLEIKDMEEHLAINLQSLDCTTLVENVCALALTTSHGGKTWKDYLSWLQKLRYDSGKINGYSSRNHYFSQWIQSGTKLGLVKEVVPPSNISVPMKLSLTYMSAHPNSYPLLKVDMAERKLIAEMEKRASGATVRYIPKERVGTARRCLAKSRTATLLPSLRTRQASTSLTSALQYGERTASCICSMPAASTRKWSSNP